MELFLIIFVLVVGFYMLWNMGANDVGNAVGTSVGSGAITLRKAILIAAVLEFLGAFTIGSNVSETIKSGIIDPLQFQYDPYIFIFGMIASLLATAVWVQIATHFRWPVSVTHAIIGAIIGFGTIVAGFHTIHWAAVGTIAISWVVSPTISAIIAYGVFSFIQQKILFSYNPLLATKKIAPYLAFIVLFTFFISTIANGIENLHIYFSVPMVILISLGIGLFGSIIVRWKVKKIHLDSQINPEVASKQSQQLYSLRKAQKHLIRAKLAASGKVSQELDDILSTVEQIKEDVGTKTKWESHLSADYRAVEKIFAGLQIITACFVAFAHGANDVANAIGPVSAVLTAIRNPSAIAAHTFIPSWLLAFGGIGIVIGLATYGWRVIETIGKSITQLTPTRGFSAEFAAASTILVASKLGLPISTTHSIVGAVLGVGLARGLSALNFPMIRDIFLSWIITIPSAAILSVLFFYIFKFTML